MWNNATSYRIVLLGESACLVDWGSRIDPALNREVMARAEQLRRLSLEGITEIIPAYSSLTICFDPAVLKKRSGPGMAAGEWLAGYLGTELGNPAPDTSTSVRHIRIPVCYDESFAPDLQRLAAERNLPVAELICLHTGREYQVYMLGFLPGFAYMGEVEEQIAAPRKEQPEAVKAGSVGIAGKQTGIYPLDSPGGWNIIGRTPLCLFNAQDEEPCLLRAGDRVQFYSIGPEEFGQLTPPLP